MIHAEPGTLTLSAGSPTVVVSPSADASLEDRVDYLIRREQESRTRLDSLDRRLGAIEEDVPERIEDLRVETREHVAGELSAAESRYRPLRFVGALLLAAGARAHDGRELRLADAESSGSAVNGIVAVVA